MPIINKIVSISILISAEKIIFPAFEYDGFKDTILFKGGQTSW